MLSNFRGIGPEAVELPLDGTAHRGLAPVPGSRTVGCVVGAAMVVPITFFVLAILLAVLELSGAVRIGMVFGRLTWLERVFASFTGSQPFWVELLVNAPEVVLVPLVMLGVFTGVPLTLRLRRREVRIDEDGLHSRRLSVRWADVAGFLADNIEWSGEDANRAVHHALIAHLRDGTRLAWYVRTFAEAEHLADQLEAMRAAHAPFQERTQPHD